MTQQKKEWFGIHKWDGNHRMLVLWYIHNHGYEAIVYLTNL